MLVLKWVLRLLPLLYMAAVFIQSSLPSNQFVELPNSFIDRNLKESLHLIEFAILYVLLVLAFLTRSRPFTSSLNVACALFAALYGVSDEFHQSFYAYRSASWFDLVKDFTGISVSFYFVRGALFKGKFMRLAGLLGRVHVVTGNAKRGDNHGK
ncbi:VanZ family protein [Neobacillus sp. OS1-2]|uniref:VanZ family protein n=1 Tax=Neobacillus sp. OS1-2 TaxID=3070680 RepID=UPI0027DFB832|nr:VanZ family protein [Neobacillus sp. OS1-2]WML41588.1 VanZ family protein [Neobacillus sp. OS1-2]